ncbi:NERD domain-containing protein [Bacillus salacetis]|uniref:NERD domain-containing protein n=1 Tax=Bacillus salacetis TaxID=2315464 RepID=UPI003B9F9314
MVGLFLLLLVAAALLNHPSVKGMIGESWIRFHLSKLDQENYFILHNILLPAQNGKTTQVDHVVVSPYGIFVIETKNYKGWIFGSEKSKQWTQQIYKSKHRFHNPIYQNYGHIEAVKKAVGEHIKLPYISIIAFNSKAELKKITVSSSDVHVTYDNRVQKVINSYQDRKMSTPYAKAVYDHLNSSAIKGKDAAKDHVSQVKADQLLLEQKVSRNICPKCNGHLVDRLGKHGRFRGCANYPECRYTA